MGGSIRARARSSRSPPAAEATATVYAETHAAPMLGRSMPPRSDIQGAASVIIHGIQKYPRGHPSASIGTHTHPHVRLGTHGQLPYLAPRFTSSATTGQCQPATVRCIGLLCKAVNMDTACVGLNRPPASLWLSYKHSMQINSALVDPVMGEPTHLIRGC